MQCKICKKPTEVAFQAKILHKYDENLYKCKSCGFLSVGEVHWLDEAYNEAINISDTGLVSRNLYLYKIVSCVAYFLFGFRDIGGGQQRI